MTTKTLEQRIDELNPDTMDWNDANAYAALGVGESDGTNPSEGQPLGDTIEAQQAANAKATSPAPAAKEPEAKHPEAKTESVEPPADAAKSVEEGKVEGVATRDGKRVIPYAVLQSTRDALRETNVALAKRQKELDDLKAQLDAATAAKAQPNEGELDEEALAELDADVPVASKAIRALQAKIKQLETQAKDAPKQEPIAATTVERESDDDAFDAGIIANPLLASWMGQPQSKEWQRAKAVDALLMQDPDHASKSYADRFAVVQRMVAAEFGVEQPKPVAEAPKPKQTPAIPQPKEAAMPSLSDLGGAAPRSEDDVWAQNTTVDLLARAEKMTDAELMRIAGITY